MDMMHPDMQQASAGRPDDERAEGEGGAVTIEKSPDGGFLVNGKPARSIDEALNMVRELLTGDDGGMSVEQAFQGGFSGGSGVPGDMGGGY